ncbi:hypothetical protein [Pseudomonas purpurea]|uniref:hypothetical protein n=1 Tax=Pseudomonas purpurea TaxID=3136737 RepID=UPI0032654553
MLDSNKTIEMAGVDAMEALAEIEFILISLRKMGTFYMDKSQEDYRKATTDFIDDFAVTQRLAKVRRLISQHFDSTLGDDDMDDLERYMQTLQFWQPEPSAG